MTHSIFRTTARTAALATAAAAFAAGPAYAQPGATATDIEVPNVVIDLNPDNQTGAADEALDLANIVQSAAKGITTVQEAPAIVTVITADEIKERQFQNLNGVIDTVPGWQSVDIYNGNYPTALARGQPQAIQFLHDGLSMFEPYVNESSINQVQPMELIKRVEMITGPGGVLWGSNSLLGIVNMITKDAEDVDGLEVGGEAGDGPGNRMYGRAYAMVGAPNLLGGKLKVFAHASVLTYQGPELTLPLLLFHNALPQPNSGNQYGPLTTTDAMQTMITTIDAKITYDKLVLRVYAPFGAKYDPAGLSGEPVTKNTPQDSMCPVGSTTPTCIDPNRLSRANREDDYDRYAVLEYRTRFADEKAGLTARIYGQQFVRGVFPLQVLAPEPVLPPGTPTPGMLPPSLQGGLSLYSNETSYRTGGAVDGDVELATGVRVLYGGEAFHEWAPEITSNLTGPGNVAYNLLAIPLICPRVFNASAVSAFNPQGLDPIAGCPITFSSAADRTVLGAYLDPQWRPNKELIFDLGGRVQVAPAALGSLSYDTTTTVAATMVWNFIPNWHLKLNYAQGFRPPVFANTNANGADVAIGGNPNLRVETSDAMQAEINARIFKGERRIRELTFRVDGSYTRMYDLITIQSGTYANAGSRGIASVEFLGKLYLQGGHRLEFGYTYLKGDSTDEGQLRYIPENTFSLAGFWNLIGSKLTATTTLKVTGATEDANRLVEYRGLTYSTCTGSDPMCVPGLPAKTVSVAATDLVMDRLPAVADLTLGLAYTPMPKLTFHATVYNALFSHAYQPDVYFDYEPHLEYLPNPYNGFRGILGMSYQY